MRIAVMPAAGCTERASFVADISSTVTMMDKSKNPEMGSVLDEDFIGGVEKRGLPISFG